MQAKRKCRAAKCSKFYWRATLCVQFDGNVNILLENMYCTRKLVLFAVSLLISFSCVLHFVQFCCFAAKEHVSSMLYVNYSFCCGCDCRRRCCCGCCCCIEPPSRPLLTCMSIHNNNITIVWIGIGCKTPLFFPPSIDLHFLVDTIFCDARFFIFKKKTEKRTELKS